MTDWLSKLWTLMDRHSECQNFSVFRDWIPDDAVDNLLARWLRPQFAGSLAICPDCNLAAEDCTVIEAPSGRTMVVATCRECGCRELPAEESAAAVFDFEQIAAFLNSTLKLRGMQETRVAGHLWWLGATPWQGKLRDVWLVRGFAGIPESTWKQSMQDSVRPIVLAMAGIPVCPPESTWWPSVARLSQVSQWQDGKLEIQLSQLTGIVKHQDDWLSARKASRQKTPHNKTIRRHVRAEINGMISNEMYVAAYRQHQSYRKAAEELSRQTGQKISKDKVARAVAAIQGGD